MREIRLSSATSKTRILIDAGLSVRELTRRLAEIGESPDDLDAVLITHEHCDHVSGLARLVRARAKKGKPLPVYISRLTAPAIDWEETASPPVEQFQAGSGWMVGNVVVQSFTIPHDAIDPVGFCFHAEGGEDRYCDGSGLRAGFDQSTYAAGADIAAGIESRCGDAARGPLPVEREAAGVEPANGHLSNGHTCDFLEKDMDSGVHTLILGHLSEFNNHPEIVRMGAAQSLAQRGMRTHLVVAEQKRQTEVFAF